MAENKNRTQKNDDLAEQIRAAMNVKPSAPAQPDPMEQTRSFGNEVPVDDRFEQFFKKTVAVIPTLKKEPEDRGEYESVEDSESGHSHSLFGRFLQRNRKPAELPPKEVQEKPQPVQPLPAKPVPTLAEEPDAAQKALERAEREADRLTAEKQERELARRRAEEKAARERARQQAVLQATREREERIAAERAAKEQAEQEARQQAAEQAAREQAEREAQQRAAEQAAREQAEREARQRAAEQAAREQAEQKAREHAAEQLAAQLAAEQAEREEAKRLAAQKQQEELARQRLAEREAHNTTTAQAALAAIEQAENTPEEPTVQPESTSFAQKELEALGAGKEETMSVKLDLGDMPEEEPEPQKKANHRMKKAAMHLFGGAQDEPDEAEDEAEETAPNGAARVQEPETPEDRKAYLEAQKAKSILRTVLSGILALVLIYLGAAARGGSLPLVEMIDPQLAPEPFVAVNMILLLLAAVLGFSVLRCGAAGILGHASGDSMPMLAMLGALVQLAAFLIKPEWYDPLHTTIFAGAAALLLCLAQAGHMVQWGSACENNELIHAGAAHEVAGLYPDQDEVIRLTDGMDETDPLLLLSRPAAELQGFLRRSFSESENEPRLQKLSWLLVICALAAAGISFVMGGEAAGAISSAAGLLCLGAPLASVLGSSLPMDLCGKSAARVGAIVPGWESAEELTESNVLHVTSDDLFPVGCIHLHGIKTFEKERIDMAILYAASILQFSSNGLKEVFMEILQNDTRMLFKTEGITKMAGKGMIGWIDNQRIIVGNRAMMAEHHIEIPSMDYENRYTKGQRSPVYLAVAGRLYGMFLLSYATDPAVLSTIEMLRAEGYSLLVSSDDFCISVEAIENAYGLNHGEVRLLNNTQKERLAPALAPVEACDGCLVHLGGFASLAGGIRAALSARSAGRAASMLSMISVLVSCVIGLVLAATGGLAGLVLPAVVLYQAAWCGLTLLAPAMKKY